MFLCIPKRFSTTYYVPLLLLFTYYVMILHQPFARGRNNPCFFNEDYWLNKKYKEIITKNKNILSSQKIEQYRKSILDKLLIDMSWASSHLEGNTYDILDTELLIKYNQSSSGKSKMETAMILNHKHAIGCLLDELNLNKNLDELFVFRIHNHLMKDLIPNESLGNIRTHGVAISSTAYQPSNNYTLLNKQLNQLIWKANQIKEPYEASFFLLTSFSYLQFFEDGNKRMGRIMSNYPLLKQGLPPLSFVGVDKKSYIQGLIEFYELGETDLLSKVFSETYQKTVLAYSLNEDNNLEKSVSDKLKNKYKIK